MRTTKMYGTPLSKIEKLLGIKITKKMSHFESLAKALIDSAREVSGDNRKDIRYAEEPIDSLECKYFSVGVRMENTTKLFEIATGQMEESKESFEKITNEITALVDVVHPLLGENIQKIRSHRMAGVREMKEMLVLLKDIREFFLGSDYKEEMERLESFISLCRELGKLKEGGVLDAICDSMINLQVKGD